MRPTFAFLAMLIPSALAAGSCALKGFTLDGSAGGSSSASGTGGGDAGPPKCGVFYPDPPVKAVVGGAIDFTVALRTINFGDKGTVGLDLDHMCTCHGDGPSCQGAKMMVTCDDLGDGRDNAAAGLLNALTLVLNPGSFGSDFYSAKAYAGDWSLLFRVRDYNGEVNDGQVEVDWYVSTGATVKGPNMPAWDGNDTWVISSDSVTPTPMDPMAPRYFDKNAYVSDSMLVASLPDAEIAVSGGTTSRMTIHLTGAGILARIGKDVTQTRWKLTEGQILGRWKIADVFASVASYRDPPICTTNPFYNTAKGFICNSPDILATPGTPAQPCDALSLGLGFTADPAAFGAITMPPQPSPGCADGGDPSTDKCN